jgi:Membrane transport protein
MDVSSLFLTALLPVVKVILMCSVGALLAHKVERSLGDACQLDRTLLRCPATHGRPVLRYGRKLMNSHFWQDVLTVGNRQLLSKLIFYVFVPSLSFTFIGKSVNLENLGSWWPLPINVLLRCNTYLSVGKHADRAVCPPFTRPSLFGLDLPLSRERWHGPIGAVTAKFGCQAAVFALTLLYPNSVLVPAVCVVCPRFRYLSFFHFGP